MNNQIVLNLNEDLRILSAGKYLVIPEGAITIDDVSKLPEGNIYEYRYVDGEFVHDPLPEPEVVVEPTEEERIEALEAQKALLSAQIQALSDRNDFLEDCIAEMACIIYA